MLGRITVATLDGRAYYRITTLLKSMGVPFSLASAGEVLAKDIALVLTTKKERSLVEHPSIICYEDLPGERGIAIATILVHANRDSELVIGLDPGVRTGYVAYLGEIEVDRGMLNSVQGVVSKVVNLVTSLPRRRSTIRIGKGQPTLAVAIARELSQRLGSLAEIELVEESGTSSLKKAHKSRPGGRDQMSARLIAFRKGRPFRPR